MPTPQSRESRRKEVRQRIAEMLNAPVESVTVPENHPLYQAQRIAESFIEQISRGTGVPRSKISLSVQLAAERG